MYSITVKVILHLKCIILSALNLDIEICYLEITVVVYVIVVQGSGVQGHSLLLMRCIKKG